MQVYTLKSCIIAYNKIDEMSVFIDETTTNLLE